MTLPLAKSRSLHDHLKLPIRHRLPINALHHPMGSRHIRRLVIRHITLDLFPCPFYLRPILRDEWELSLVDPDNR
jgi:hypothetical protein